MTTKSDSCFYSQIRQYLILINCPTRQFLLLFISSLYWYLYSYGAILIAAFVCDVWDRMMKQCNVLALPNFTGGQDDRQKKDKKTKRQKDRKTRKTETNKITDKIKKKQKNKKTRRRKDSKTERTQLLLLGKFEYTGGPIFKVVLEC